MWNATCQYVPQGNTTHLAKGTYAMYQTLLKFPSRNNTYAEKLGPKYSDIEYVTLRVWSTQLKVWTTFSSKFKRFYRFFFF